MEQKKIKKERVGNPLIKKVFISIGLVYVLGLFLRMYNWIYSLLAPTLENLYASQFMTARLIPVADFVVTPLRILVSLAPIILPAIFIVWAFMFLLKKINIYKDTELKWIMIAVLLMFAVST